jgi:hypothetical protein
MPFFPSLEKSAGGLLFLNFFQKTLPSLLFWSAELAKSSSYKRENNPYQY